MTAAAVPQQTAVVEPARRDRNGNRQYRTVTFDELERDTNRIASGLLSAGARRGMRMVLLVPPSIEFIALTFALLKAGVVIVLIDPGMGRKNLIRCLQDAQPEGFISLPLVQAVRVLMKRRFPKASLNVTLGRRWFWGGYRLDEIRSRGRDDFTPAETSAADPGAIIFTTGSTGPPKGVEITHGNFEAHVEQIRDGYGIAPGEIDLPGFPLFGLFNAAMGVTTVIPDMDPTRPAKVNPKNIIEAVHDWNVTQSFGSPALWNVVGTYCEENGVKLPTLRRVLSAGAPVPPDVVRRVKAAMGDDGEIHTPYGATEALPVATISGTEILGETAAKSEQGAGTCVGHRFSGIQWRIIRITDDPIPTIDQVEELPPGEIGELIVRGPVITRRYVTRTEANATSKIADGDGIWHRMGDVGYLDEQERFWFCGRKAHRVMTAQGPMYTISCEAIFNRHEAVFRTALVGVGPAGRQRPVIVVELQPAKRGEDKEQLRAQLREFALSNPLTETIEDFLFHPSFPVDIRHNAKIFREKLAVWAARRAERLGATDSARVSAK